MNAERVEYQDGSGCSSCGELTERIVIGGHKVHYARIECAGCGRFLKWQGKPKSKISSKRGKSQSKLVSEYSRGFCELCLRLEDQIPPPQTIEAHHITPYVQGGSDERENIWILCTSCHKLVHHQRTYLGHGFEQYEEKAS